MDLRAAADAASLQSLRTLAKRLFSSHAREECGITRRESPEEQPGCQEKPSSSLSLSSSSSSSSSSSCIIIVIVAIIIIITITVVVVVVIITVVVVVVISQS
nr:hypothetical protein BaRGS_033611 [Batillaria attramentaria]